MELWKMLFSTDFGLQSIAVIFFILGMFVWFGFYFKRHMDEDARREKQ
jgi:Protein of unknown function (DUF3149)